MVHAIFSCSVPKTLVIHAVAWELVFVLADFVVQF